MPSFVLDSGRLARAAFGRITRGGLSEEVCRTVREGVIDLLDDALFPVAWDDGDPPVLTAMDRASSVVNLAVVHRLDRGLLMDLLARAGRDATSSWSNIAERYDGGIPAFRRDWNAFREALPTASKPGARIVALTGELDAEVAAALPVLERVQVLHLQVRSTETGQLMVELDDAAGLRTHPVPTGAHRARAGAARSEADRPPDREEDAADKVASDEVKSGAVESAAATDVARADDVDQGSLVLDRASVQVTDVDQTLPRAPSRERALSSRNPPAQNPPAQNSPAQDSREQNSPAQNPPQDSAVQHPAGQNGAAMPSMAGRTPEASQTSASPATAAHRHAAGSARHAPEPRSARHAPEPPQTADGWATGHPKGTNGVGLPDVAALFGAPVLIELRVDGSPAYRAMLRTDGILVLEDGTEHVDLGRTTRELLPGGDSDPWQAWHFVQGGLPLADALTEARVRRGPPPDRPRRRRAAGPG